ncbi:12571_t:CDS:1, partial [Cetraspora pellucida]
PKKVLAMSKIWSDILYSCKVKNTKEYNNCIHHLYIATPISSDDESVEEELTVTDLNCQMNDNEYEGNVEEEATRFSNAKEADTRSSNVEKAATRSSNIEETAARSSNVEEAATRFRNWTNKNFEDEYLVTEEEQQWENTINEWIELEEYENQFEDQGNEILLTNNWNTDFGFGRREKHPVDDETAKWPLDSLFISSLEVPQYFDSE